MRILFVAMVDSIHTARWINQVSDLGWDIHLFPCVDADIQGELRNTKVHGNIFHLPEVGSGVRQPGALLFPFPTIARSVNYWAKKIRNSKYIANVVSAKIMRLANLVQKLEPDLIHSLEFQHSAYLTLEAKKLIGSGFPPWMVTNWGSDIFLFGRLPEHASKIREVLQNCDYYSCECQRDVDLGRSFGFKGEIMPVLPNTGGLEIERIRQLRQPGPTSSRRLILVKGYQSWAGRALVALRALELCADILNGYRVAVYLAQEDVILKAQLLTQATGIPVDIIPACSHREMLSLHGHARISIGLSISDGISTSFLEAIAMGSFPIQSCTACADEWIIDGVTGLLVPPEDPQFVADAIRKALTNDELVDRAAEMNLRVAEERLDQRKINQQIVDWYQNLDLRKKVG